MSQGSIPIFTAAATALAVSNTASASGTINGPSGMASDAYYVMNTSSQPIWVVITNTPNPTAVFPTPGSPQVGFAVPPNLNIFVRGVPCGNGASAYVAALGATGSGNVYITPSQT